MRPVTRRIAAAFCLVTTGCSSSYVPRPSPKVSLAVIDGDLAAVRDGQAVPLGIFGTGLEDVVAENPEARDHAETFTSFTVAGFVIGILGAGATGGGVGLWVGNESGDRNEGLRAAGIGLTMGGIALSLTGAIFQIAAQPHLYDAINIYNDSVPAEYGPAPSYPPAGAYPPGAYPEPSPSVPAAPRPTGPPIQSAPPPATPPPADVPPARAPDPE
ncbi:MAG: hypothetical protein RIF41_32135, partial [Polyangiaceae bacterium]